MQKKKTGLTEDILCLSPTICPGNVLYNRGKGRYYLVLNRTVCNNGLAWNCIEIGPHMVFSKCVVEDNELDIVAGMKWEKLSESIFKYEQIHEISLMTIRGRGYLSMVYQWFCT